MFYSTFIFHDVYWKVKLERLVDGTCMMANILIKHRSSYYRFTLRAEKLQHLE